MAKESIIQIRMDETIRKDAEEVYRKLGTSLPEAIRVFTAQSILENGFPFQPRVYKKEAKGNCQGCLSKYSDTTLTERESSAFMDAVVEKYGKIG